VDGALLELLTWISSRPRTYAETIEAWRSNCPRLSTWDDALVDGLARVHSDGRVELTALGAQALSDAQGATRPDATNASYVTGIRAAKNRSQASA
jgi:hypothetical protein